MMAERWRNLPEELWELILKKLPHHSHFEPLSLVSKQFLNLTNQSRTKLVATDALRRTGKDIPSLINKRCPNIITLDLNDYPFYLEDLLLGMANNCEIEKLREIILPNVYDIHIRSLIELGSKIRGIRVLKFKRIQALCDQDLVDIGNTFPRLEELDVSYPMTDFSDWGPEYSGLRPERVTLTFTDIGIRGLSMIVKNLRRISLSGNDFFTDRALVYLSENCEFLEEVDVVDCKLVTAKGVLSLLRNSVHLNSISASGIDTGNGSLGSEDMSFSGRRLCSLDLRNSFISEEFMDSLIEACVDLRKLSLLKCTGLEVSSLALLLRKCHLLQHLALDKVDCVTDEFIFELFPYLHNLVSLELSNSSISFAVISLHTVVERCASLKSVQMKCVGRRIMCLRSRCVKYLNIKSLNLSGSVDLDNNCLIEMAFACPNLETLDISNCSITEKCLAEILDTCHEISFLRIKSCKINSIGKGSVLPKLVTIIATYSAINDEGLAQIAIRCPRLERLGLQGCSEVTDKGLNQLVGTCHRLKEINLLYCSKVHCVNMIRWMIATRPSLVKIAPPYSISSSDIERIFGAQNECQIGHQPPLLW